jgi:hypothetical protein
VIELFDTSARILAAKHDGAADALREAIGSSRRRLDGESTI